MLQYFRLILAGLPRGTSLVRLEYSGIAQLCKLWPFYGVSVITKLSNKICLNLGILIFNVCRLRFQRENISKRYYIFCFSLQKKRHHCLILSLISNAMQWQTWSSSTSGTLAKKVFNNFYSFFYMMKSILSWLKWCKGLIGLVGLIFKINGNNLPFTTFFCNLNHT